MAPTQKRASIRSRAARSAKPAKSSRDAVSHPAATYTPSALSLTDAEPDWRTSKKDKRAMKHSVLMSKVRNAGVTKTKRRRPAKKLGVELSGLGDALPDVGDGANGDDDGEWEGLSGEEGGMEVDGSGLKVRKRKRAGREGKMVMKSIKVRPGAMKRKRALEGREMERFGRNLAQLVGSGEGIVGVRDSKANRATEGHADGNTKVTGEGTSQADRWAALRRFIGSSMEKDKAFAKG